MENIIYKNDKIKEVVVFGIPDVILGESIIAFATTFSEWPSPYIAAVSIQFIPDSIAFTIVFIESLLR